MALLLALTLLAEGATAAWGYDPATTQAGLTERAVLASTLHTVLSRRMGRPLGLLEPLQINAHLLAVGPRHALAARIEALDPAGGYRPNPDGINSAISWLVAGAVLSQTPPERGRNHFLDPRTGKGLDDGPRGRGLLHATKLAFDGTSGLRGLATGSAFDLTGRSAPDWLVDPQNDQSIRVFLDAWEAAVLSPQVDAREGALVRALMALGGMAAVLENMGEPAHVRNDFRGAFLNGGSGGWDRSSAFEQFVAERYGQQGVPAARGVILRPTWRAYFTAADQGGLADRTQRRFFSDGTVPASVPVPRLASPADVEAVATETMTLFQPAIQGLNLAPGGGVRYLRSEGRRLLAYEVTGGRIRFFLDAAVHADSAKALLPEVAAYAAGFLDFWLRPRVDFAVKEGGQVELTLAGVDQGIDGAHLQIVAEDRAGVRHLLAGPPSPPSLTFAAGTLGLVTLPAGTRRVAAVLRGQRPNGDPVVASGEAAIH